jgi:hypothetical protein
MYKDNFMGVAKNCTNLKDLRDVRKITYLGTLKI